YGQVDKKKNYYPIWTFHKDSININGISVGLWSFNTDPRYTNTNGIKVELIGSDKKGEILKMISKNPFNYHIIPDSKEFIQNNYKVSMYPTHLVLDKEGKVAFHTSGYSPNTVSSIENSILDKLK
ncbi:MAG: hypothetical protein EBU80_10285, partial [Chitinophagia bacterium]|nr:hypothetical protein [Chitinophagia bacterium]